jgi:ADP-ribose pyrophosphatase YjhB (NUDIX family)
MYVIGVTTTYDKEELIHADYHISDFEKLDIDIMRKNVQQNLGMKILNLAKQAKAISETGLTYQQNEYDRERYEQVKAISLNIISILSGVSIDVLKSFYLPIHDYPTPKVDVRGFVLNKSGSILMVKEIIDGKWSLPGGWADVGLSPSEVVEKEILEETGLKVKVDKLCAVFDKKCHPHPPQPFYVYKIVFLCSVVVGSVNPDFDIEDVGWFSTNNLPELPTDRILRSQIEKLYDMVISKERTAIFD